MGRASPVQFSLTDDRSRNGWCCGNGHSSTQNCKSALCFTSRSTLSLAANFSTAAIVEATRVTGREPKPTVAVVTGAEKATGGGFKYSWSRRNVLHDSWTERHGRVDGAPINRNEERMAQEHGQTNCEACHRRIIEIGVHCRLQHGEDKQESHHELTHQSVPIAPSFSDSVGTRSLRAILQSNPVTQS